MGLQNTIQCPNLVVRRRSVRPHEATHGTSVDHSQTHGWSCVILCLLYKSISSIRSRGKSRTLASPVQGRHSTAQLHPDVHRSRQLRIFLQYCLLCWRIGWRADESTDTTYKMQPTEQELSMESLELWPSHPTPHRLGLSARAAITLDLWRLLDPSRSACNRLRLTCRPRLSCTIRSGYILEFGSHHH